MSGGIQAITLPAGYLGSSFIGACLIACGFDTKASKVACLVLAVFFLFTLWWARKNWLYVRPKESPPNEVLKFSQILGLNCRHVRPHNLILVRRRCSRPEIPCEQFSYSVLGIRMTCPQVLFIGVMSCMYVLWDVIGAHSLLHLRAFDSHAVKMIPSAGRSTILTRAHSLTFVVAAPLEVSTT